MSLRGYLVALCLICAPLVWVRLPLAGASLSIIFMAALIATYSLDSAKLMRVVVANQIFFAIMAFFVIAALGAYFHPRPAYDALAAMRIIFYASGAVCIATWVASAGKRGLSRLIWVGPIGCACCIGLLLIGANDAGVNVLGNIVEGVTRADPRVLQYGIFRAIFSAELEGAQGNWRHNVVGGLMAVSLVSLCVLSGERRRWVRGLVYVTAALGGIVILISMSRSIILALLFAAAVVVVKAFIHKPEFRARIAWVTGALLLSLAIIGQRYLEVLSVRFFSETESGSYSARVRVIEEGLDTINQNPVLGNSLPSGEAMHNMILQHWVGAGFLGGIVAMLFFVALLNMSWRLFFIENMDVNQARSRGLSSIFVPALLVLPLVRALTAGGGLSGTEWSLIGFAVGVQTRALYFGGDQGAIVLKTFGRRRLVNHIR